MGVLFSFRDTISRVSYRKKNRSPTAIQYENCSSWLRDRVSVNYKTLLNKLPHNIDKGTNYLHDDSVETGLLTAKPTPTSTRERSLARRHLSEYASSPPPPTLVCRVTNTNPTSPTKPTHTHLYTTCSIDKRTGYAACMHVFMRYALTDWGENAPRAHNLKHRHAAILIGKTLALAQAHRSVCLFAAWLFPRTTMEEARIIIFIEKLSSFAARRPIFHKA